MQESTPYHNTKVSMPVWASHSNLQRTSSRETSTHLPELIFRCFPDAMRPNCMDTCTDTGTELSANLATQTSSLSFFSLIATRLVSQSLKPLRMYCSPPKPHDRRLHILRGKSKRRVTSVLALTPAREVPWFTAVKAEFESDTTFFLISRELCTPADCWDGSLRVERPRI
jgi:hypothetical protein